MKPVILFASVLAFLLPSPSAAVTSSFPINVWPKPTTFLWPSPQTATLLSPTFTITATTAADNPHLSAAVSRYLNLILTEHHRPLITPHLNLSTTSTPLLLLSISIAEPQTPLSHAVDESYNLVIPSAATTVANLTAVTAWGAMRGLETFSQLVYGSPSRVAVGIEISDAPIYPHRGLMLDTSRNFYAVEDILRTIGGMSQNKMNVFHWHITDSHSFPIVLPSEPDLAERGSYGSEMVYSPEDVRRIVEFGLEHGVRVLPEIDTPGHTGSWAAAYPEIVACANMFWWPAGSSWDDRLASEPGTGHLNPLHPQTFQVVKNVMSDIADMFPETFFHAGADEIIPGCWKADPSIQSFLSGGGTLGELLETFVNKTYAHLLSLNKTVVYWEDVLLDGTISVKTSVIPKETTILQTWNNGPKNTKRIVSAGYRAIVSSSSFYYLDCGHGDFLGNDSQYNQPPGADQKDGGSWCGPFKTWSLIYNYDITDGLTAEEAKLVLGGEVALWSEQADPTVLDARLWPRTSAFAEAIWSGNRDETGAKRFAEATDRLNEWRYRMVRRGIGAEPIQPLWCIRNPGMCNTVNVA